MRRIGTIGLAALLAGILAGTVLAAASVNLGTAKSFAVLAGTTITNTGATTITGDVGLHPGTAVTGFTTVTLDGAQHLGDAVALDAKNALVTAYNEAAGATPVTNVPTELGGTTLKPGVYASDTLGLTGTLTLDGEGLYIFQAASTLITAPNSVVALINGASACNVYWQVGSSATLDTSTSFKGTIMALTSIALNTGATLQGRALARNGAVTMDHNTIDSSACAAPSPTPTPVPSPTVTPVPSPTVTPVPSPVGTPTSGTNPAVTPPPTDTLASTPAAIADPLSATFLVLLVIAAAALVGSLRFAAIRSRPRD
jgi:cell division septation protein DedD